MSIHHIIAPLFRSNFISKPLSFKDKSSLKKIVFVCTDQLPAGEKIKQHFDSTLSIVMIYKGTTRLAFFFIFGSCPLLRMNWAACPTLNYAFNFSPDRITLIKHGAEVKIFNMPNLSPAGRKLIAKAKKKGDSKSTYAITTYL